MGRRRRDPTPDVTVVWLRRDLRLGDNPALLTAVRRTGSLLPVSLWPEDGGPWPPGAASRWWLWHSLGALDDALRRRTSRLVVDEGPPAVALVRLATESGAGAVVWAAGLDAAEREDDEAVAAALRDRGVEGVVVRPANLMHEPAGLLTAAGRPYTVFTPFWRALLARSHPPAPLAPPTALPPAPADPPGLALGSLRGRAVPPWASRFDGLWHPGEDGARAALARFLDEALESYAEDRDRPDLEGSSRLSPHLHWGELTARQVWRAVADHLEERGVEFEAAVRHPTWDRDEAPGLRRSTGAFLRQLGWREFGHDLLWHFPTTPERPLHDRFELFPWRTDTAALEAWQRGLTGIPIVDAGMRQLWLTGWLHNRARLVTASFLTKHLLLHWRDGADWFWDTLVDADLADNTLGWQWVAGCGADAAPFFRIMNPVTQGRRHDPDGAYVRAWVPELREVPLEHIHAPWLAPPGTLADAGVRVGVDYPAPIVDLGEARSRALAAYDIVRRGR